jgi:hypothetical protein
MQTRSMQTRTMQTRSMQTRTMQTRSMTRILTIEFNELKKKYEVKYDLKLNPMEQVKQLITLIETCTDNIDKKTLYLCEFIIYSNDKYIDYLINNKFNKKSINKFIIVLYNKLSEFDYELKNSIKRNKEVVDISQYFVTKYKTIMENKYKDLILLK